MENILGAIIICLFAILFFVLGYLVLIKEKIALFHSYHYDKVSEENKKIFCKISGIGLIIIGTGLMIAAFISVAGLMWGHIIFALGFLIGLSMLIYAGIKYNQ